MCLKSKLFFLIFFLCVSLCSTSVSKAKEGELPTEQNENTEPSENENINDKTTENDSAENNTVNHETTNTPSENPSDLEDSKIIPPTLSKDSLTITYGKSSAFPKIKNLPSDYEITYSTSDPAVAAVKKDGAIKGTGIGKCKIAALLITSLPEKEEPITYELILNVNVTCAVKAISFDYLENSLILLGTGQKRKLIYTVSPKSALTPPLEFHSSSPTIASVSKDGTIKAKKVGKAKITLSIKGMKKIFASINVQVTKRSAPFSYSMKKLPIVSTQTARYTYQTMVKDLKQLEETYGDRISVSKIAATYDNRNLYEILLGNPNAKSHIVISSSMHAREYMTSLLTMKQLEYYCFYYYTGKYKGLYYNELFHNVCIHLIPMVNPDGVTISQYGAKGIHNASLRRNVIAMCKKYGRGLSSYYTTWKANGRGVDLNRNYDISWNTSANQVKHPCAASYKGKSPASEKETQAIVQIINKTKPKATINYHAMGSIIYWYFGQKGELLENSKKLLNVVKGLTSYSPVGGSYNRRDAAGLGDWVSVRKKLPTVTIEIGKSPCPLKIREFSSIWYKNREVWAAASSLYD